MSTKKTEVIPWPVDEELAEEPEKFHPVEDTVLASNATEREKYLQRVETESAAVRAALVEPLDRSLLKTRRGPHNKDLEYLEWHTVVRSLNRIFGMGNWSWSVKQVQPYGACPTTGAPLLVTAIAELEIHWPDGRYTTYTNTGTNGVTPTYVYENGKRTNQVYYTWDAFEMAYKGAGHDALKRCATALGEQFGLSLYMDETAKAPEEQEAGGATVTPFKPRQTPPSPDTSGEMENFRCEDCGTTVTGYTAKSGKTYTAQDLFNMSVKYAGGGYCYSCKQKHQA